ncbi:MAG: hypothetical protein MSG64_09675 [Pyrinomonadaceae bacterium MAG19_C2-C3]|nr:hypothetical protein [Pyrinomonadaceae bacterium MAG19_C2-C3]
MPTVLFMFPFTRLKWREMRPLVLDLIERLHAGHRERHFALPVVDFVRVFAPDASADELAKVAARSSMFFVADGESGGAFTLAEGEQATFDLGRENFHLRIPPKMSGRYELFDSGFRITFTENEQLLGCKRILVLICHRITSVDVTTTHIHTHAPNRMFDLFIEFE